MDAVAAVTVPGDSATGGRAPVTAEAAAVCPAASGSALPAAAAATAALEDVLPLRSTGGVSIRSCHRHYRNSSELRPAVGIQTRQKHRLTSVLLGSRQAEAFNPALVTAQTYK